MKRQCYVWFFVLVFTLLLAAVSAAQASVVTYENPLSAPVEELKQNPNLRFNSAAEFLSRDGKLYSAEADHASLGYSAPLYNFTGEVELQTMQQRIPGDVNHAVGVGCRVPTDGSWITDNALWFMIYGNQLHLRLMPNDTAITFTIPVDYSSPNKVYLEDRGSEVILYGGPDRVKLCSVTITADKVIAYNAAGEKQGEHDKQGLADSGYFRVMPHFVEATVADFAVSFEDEISLQAAFVNSSDRFVYPKVYLRKNTQAEISAVALTGLYDGEKLLDVAYSENLFADGQAGVVNSGLSMPQEAGTYTLKTVVFNRKGSLRPLLDAPVVQTFEADGIVYKNDSFGAVAAVDDLGRALPLADQVGAYKTDQERFVGIFYFLWKGEHGTDGPYDVQEILDNNPSAIWDESVWGPVGSMHFWGRPMYGYYVDSDEWVMRRNIEMLTMADVDFLYFDVTNGITYDTSAMQMMRLLHEYRQQGWDTPKVVFYTNSASGQVIQHLYETIYRENYMPDTWFVYDGRPVIVGDSAEVSAEVQAFFNIKVNQWPTEERKTNGWPWMEFSFPAPVYKNTYGVSESMNISVAQHCVMGSMANGAFYGAPEHGRSWHNGSKDTGAGAVNYGYNFQEQWDNALQKDPRIALVTGWNEWVAQRQPASDAGVIQFVDCATIEYSRDIEPMHGGYFDSYYLQMIANIRAYKGCAPTPVQPQQHTINVAGGDFSDWDDVAVTYYNFAMPKENGGFIKRNSIGFGGTLYQSRGERSNFLEAKVAHDSNNLYFYVKTAENISLSAKTNEKMRLYIKLNAKAVGYEYVTRFSSATSAFLYPCSGITPGDGGEGITSATNGKEYMLQIPKEALGISGSDISLQFKWLDSSTPVTSFEDFYLDGDTAPLGRFNYVFTTK